MIPTLRSLLPLLLFSTVAYRRRWRRCSRHTTTATTTDGHSHLQQCGGKFLKLRPEGSFYRWCLACLLSRLAGYRQALGSGKKAELNWLEILKWLALSIHVENYASRVEHYQKIDNSCFVVSTRRRWLHAYVLGPRDYRVYHIEMDETKWLWGVEGSIILLNYGT